ncbi:hypothetical protein ACQCVK_19360 [Rossellomorea vietnamensis]|uniref:hypothetical protein n=1 Tax=Rossellomorea vietnamensis TaxID=218284 RepID=UPI003CE9CE89
MYNLSEEDFRPLSKISVDIGSLSAFHAKAPTEGKETHLFLLPFPSAGNVFKDGSTMLEYFRVFTDQYLRPLMGNDEGTDEKINPAIPSLSPSNVSAAGEVPEIPCNPEWIIQDTSRNRRPWTKEENLVIYQYLNLFEERSDKENALMIKKFERLSKIIERGLGAITPHVKALRELREDLNVPDPVHNGDRGFNNY